MTQPKDKKTPPPASQKTSAMDGWGTNLSLELELDSILDQSISSLGQGSSLDLLDSILSPSLKVKGTGQSILDATQPMDAVTAPVEADTQPIRAVPEVDLGKTIPIATKAPITPTLPSYPKDTVEFTNPSFENKDNTTESDELDPGSTIEEPLPASQPAMVAPMTEPIASKPQSTDPYQVAIQEQSTEDSVEPALDHSIEVESAAKTTLTTEPEHPEATNETTGLKEAIETTVATTPPEVPDTSIATADTTEANNTNDADEGIDQTEAVEANAFTESVVSDSSTMALYSAPPTEITHNAATMQLKAEDILQAAEVRAEQQDSSATVRLGQSDIVKAAEVLSKEKEAGNTLQLESEPSPVENDDSFAIEAPIRHTMEQDTLSPEQGATKEAPTPTQETPSWEETPKAIDNHESVPNDALEAEATAHTLSEPEEETLDAKVHDTKKPAEDILDLVPYRESSDSFDVEETQSPDNHVESIASLSALEASPDEPMLATKNPDLAQTMLYGTDIDAETIKQAAAELVRAREEQHKIHEDLPLSHTLDQPVIQDHITPDNDTGDFTDPTNDSHEIPTNDSHEFPTNDSHEIPTNDSHDIPTNDSHEIPTNITAEEIQQVTADESPHITADEDPTNATDEVEQTGSDDSLENVENLSRTLAYDGPQISDVMKEVLARQGPNVTIQDPDSQDLLEELAKLSQTELAPQDLEAPILSDDEAPYSLEHQHPPATTEEFRAPVLIDSTEWPDETPPNQAVSYGGDDLNDVLQQVLERSASQEVQEEVPPAETKSRALLKKKGGNNLVRDTAVDLDLMMNPEYQPRPTYKVSIETPSEANLMMANTTPPPTSETPVDEHGATQEFGPPMADFHTVSHDRLKAPTHASNGTNLTLIMMVIVLILTAALIYVLTFR